MKISRFRQLMGWLALASCGWSAADVAAGDLARAKARVTTVIPVISHGGVEPATATTSPATTMPTLNAAEPLRTTDTPQTAPLTTPAPRLITPSPEPSLEEARRPDSSMRRRTGALYTPAPTAPAPSHTAARPTFTAPSISAPPRGATLLTPALPTAPAPTTDTTAAPTATSPAFQHRNYHNMLRDDAGDTTETTTESTTIVHPALKTAAEPAKLPASETKPTGKVEPQVEAKVAPKTELQVEAKAAPKVEPKVEPKIEPKVATQTTPAAVAPRVGRATDAAPIRTADPSQPGRLPGVAFPREPADADSQKLFESEKEIPLTPELLQLKKRTQTALALYYQNWTLNTQEHSPWEVMHAIIAYGVDTRLKTAGTPGTTTAIGHLCYSGVCHNQPILTIHDGRLYALRGPGVQGHPGQFLAILAQSYLQRDYPLYVGGEKFTLEDLIKAEMLDCEAGTELTFKLISLMHYLPSDAEWTNSQGQKWSLDRLVREEIVQPVRGAACGGTHRLMGLSYAVRKREQRGESIDGIYLEAKKYIDQYHKYTFGLQNTDGSFSTAWFVRREARNDIDRRMQTTGHILEWLCFSLSDEQLRDPRVVKAVKYVTDILLNEHYTQWEIGHLGHGLHALQIYNERVFGGQVRSFEGLVTRKPLTTAQQPAKKAR